ncbi:MAG: hypothetical protein RSA80_09610 [Lachnospiraceae bacterium]
MEKENTPYLCGGTFLTQILRARKELTTSTDHKKGQKESLSEQETFRRLISIYQLSDFLGGTSLKTYTSKYKNCTDSLVAFGQFSDNDLHRAFDEDIKSSHSTALRMMAEFAQEFIDPNLWLQLVRCLIDMIDLDSEISDDTEFFITADSTATKAKCIPALDHFYIEPFLLGVWHYIIMNRSDDNEKGADTYKQWYLGKGDYRGTVGNGIVQSIMVESLPVVAFENTDTINNSSVEEPEAEVVGSKDSTQEEAKSCTQYIENATIVNQNGEKNIHIDHVDTLNL